MLPDERGRSRYGLGYYGHREDIHSRQTKPKQNLDLDDRYTNQYGINTGLESKGLESKGLGTTGLGTTGQEKVNPSSQFNDTESKTREDKADEAEEEKPPTFFDFTQNTTFHGVKYIFEGSVLIRK